jgi:hypothetical protein
MEILSLIIAVRRQVHSRHSTTDSVRDRTADALNRLEQLARGKERPKPGEPSEPPTRADTR